MLGSPCVVAAGVVHVADQVVVTGPVALATHLEDLVEQFQGCLRIIALSVEILREILQRRLGVHLLPVGGGFLA